MRQMRTKAALLSVIFIIAATAAYADTVSAPQPQAPIVTFGPTVPEPTVAAPSTVISTPAPAARATTQNTVQTTGPVSSETTISVGTLAGQVLTWAATAFGSVLATVFAAWGVRLFKLAGVQMTDAMRDRLQEIILNGLNAAAQQEAQSLTGKGKVEVKEAIVANAIAYTQSHGAATITALGLDPKSGDAVEAIKARIATAINDPNIPTPAALGPAVTPQAKGVTA